MLQLGILFFHDSGNGISQAESYQHQSHTSRYSENCHKQPFFVTEQVPEGRLPGKTEVFPQDRDPLHQHPFSLLRSGRTHQSRRCFRQRAVAGEHRRSHCAHHRRHRGDQGVFPFIMYHDGILNIMIHHTVRLNDDIWKKFLSYQNSRDTSADSGKESIIQVFGRNIILAVTQGF